MKYSTRLSDAVHIMVYVAQSRGETLTSGDIARSVHTNPSYVRQLMARLKAAGLLITSRGQANPTPALSPDKITLCDMYRAVEGGKPLLHLDTHTNPECGIGVNIQAALGEYYEKVQRAAENEMRSITLQDVIDSFEKKASGCLKSPAAHHAPASSAKPT